KGTTITSSKTEDKKLLRFMWQPQLRIEATLGTYHGAIGARHIISQVRVLLGVALGHQEEDCRTRIPVAGGNSLQNVTCFGCGNHGHYRSDCSELKNRN
ncbi:reverse transcriptase domain-containing protein, partial [Tanacetum coccineum]